MIDLPKTITQIDDDYALPRTGLDYPYINILKPTDALPLIVSSLAKGDLPLLVTYEGVTREVARISKSALVISKLLPITELEFVQDVNTKTILKTGEDILKLGVI